MFHKALPEPDADDAPAELASLSDAPILSGRSGPIDPAGRNGGSVMRDRAAGGAGSGEDPLHFGEIDGVLELVADGPTGVLDGPRTPPDAAVEMASLRRELEETRAELNQVRASAGEAPAWLGMTLLGMNPVRRLTALDSAISEKSRELKQLRLEVSSARDVARRMNSSKAEIGRLEGIRVGLQERIAELEDAERSFGERARKLARLKEEEQTLRESVDKLQGWMRRLQNDVDGYEAVIPMELEKLATCRRERDGVVSQLESERVALAELRGELQSLSSCREAEAVETEAVRSQLDQLRETLGAERSGFEDLTREVNELRSVVATLQQEKNEAESRRNAYRDQGDRLCAAAQEVEAKCLIETRKLEELTGQVSRFVKEHGEAQSGVEQARAELGDLSARVKVESEKLAALEGVVRERERTVADLAALRGAVEELDEMRRMGQDEVEALDLSLARSRESLTALQAETDRHEKQERQAREKAAGERQRLEELESAVAERETKLSRHAVELEAMQARREKLTEEIEEAAGERERLGKQCAIREEELAAQRDSLAALQSRFGSLQSMAATRQRELKEAEGRLNDLKTGHEEVIQTHRSQLEKLLGKVSEANTALEVIGDRIAFEEARGEAFEGERRVELAALESVRDGLQEEIAERHRELSDLEAGVSQYREFLGGLEERYRELEASFQSRMDELQSARVKAEDDLATKLCLVNETSAKLDFLLAQKRDLGEAMADCERVVALKERAAERLRHFEDRERDLHERITRLEKKSMSLSRS
ncbi:MAG: Chromosome segregation ATPase/Chromosome segregation ATPase [Verrucomicrobia bacterium]|nr:MAG: Chromosome segregation ATPase/Chromosome segregation ATPase [Verrucomicrobiota bacterium]